MRRIETRRDRRGAAAAEFALTAPIMVLLLLATVEYGNYFSQLAIVNSVAIEGARYGVNQDDGDDNDELAGNDPATEAQVAVAALLGDIGFDCGGAITCSVTTDIDTSTDPDTLEVVLDVQYAQITGALPSSGWWGFLSPQVLKARAAYPIVGP